MILTEFIDSIQGRQKDCHKFISILCNNWKYFLQIPFEDSDSMYKVSMVFNLLHMHYDLPNLHVVILGFHRFVKRLKILKTALQ